MRTFATVVHQQRVASFLTLFLGGAMFAGYLLLVPLLSSLTAQPAWPSAAGSSVPAVTTAVTIRQDAAVIRHRRLVTHHVSLRSPVITVPQGPPAANAPAPNAPANGGGMLVVSGSSDSVAGSGGSAGQAVCQGSGC